MVEMPQSQQSQHHSGNWGTNSATKAKFIKVKPLLITCEIHTMELRKVFFLFESLANCQQSHPL